MLPQSTAPRWFLAPKTALMIFYIFPKLFNCWRSSFGVSLLTGKTRTAAAIGPLQICKSNGITIALTDLTSRVRLEHVVIRAGGTAATMWENAQNLNIDPTQLYT